jgi:hypothetical protein
MLEGGAEQSTKEAEGGEVVDYDDGTPYDDADCASVLLLLLLLLSFLSVCYHPIPSLALCALVSSSNQQGASPVPT